MMPELHTAMLPPAQRRLFKILVQQTWLEKFYLVGGTALALYLGHRRSVDFDFFCVHDIQRRTLRERLARLGVFQLFTEADNSIEGTLDTVRVSFFTYRYPLLQPLLPQQHLRIADMLDIALMKLDAISGRGSRKDFVDLYFLLRQYPLPVLLTNYAKKYGVHLNNQYHLLKSLLYFADAERDPMPRMTKRLPWPVVTRNIISTVRRAGVLE